MVSKDIGYRLRRAREHKRLTQKEVADKIGIHNSTLGKYELGEREPDIETIRKLADVYEVSAFWLLVGGNTNEKSREKTRPEEIVGFEKTIELIENEAEKLGMTPSDPEFLKMLTNAFELLRIARRKDSE